MSDILRQKSFKPRLKLKRSFFNQPTIKVARQLLGCYLARRIGSKVIRARITETEAYVGPRDKASHASRGRTARNEVMFSKPGYYYIYLIYGMYYCLNVVTEKDGYPAAVLIRGVELINKPNVKNVQLDQNNFADNIRIEGPGRVCRALRVDKHFNKADAIVNKQLWLEKGKLGKQEKIATGKRINVPYAGPWQHKLWRFYIKK